MASGVQVRDECVTTLEEIRMDRLYRYVVLGLSDDLKEICVLKKSSRDATYEDFIEDMMDAAKKRQCRYAIFDVSYDAGNGDERAPREKLCLIMWSPDNATIKQKMLYTSSSDALKKKLEGISKHLQATDMDEISWETILTKCK
ncbi:uncharacterized protein LOC141914879 [Tubulanus polymorphus]|uniref:uncharacterized protein LOC141914879 n=1 Tax=Tubulanus polymorphus TaxID=672921 RepID=UPI003DA5A5D4